MTKWLVRLASSGAIVVASLSLLVSASVYADDPLQSPHYKFVESDLGGGGLVQSSSASYQSTQSVGDTAIGNSGSGNFQTEAGSQTTADPALSVVINSGGGNFGAFTPTAAATATSTFSITDYTSYGYMVEIVGDPPTNGRHTIPAMSAPGLSVPGTEQFGINLVKNTDFCGSGCNVGADPDYGQFGATQAKPAPNYDTPGKFYYSDGSTIVQSPKSSGTITYTITYLINVGSLTPGGEYTSHESLICIATY